MTLRKLTRPQLETLYRQELKPTFPPAELRPLSAIKRMAKAGNYLPLGWEEEGAFLGYAFLWREEEGGYLLLDYLGITASRRGQGFGAALLTQLAETFAGEKGIFGEVEAPDGGPDDPLRLSRLDFYRRCGFRRLPYDCRLFGVRYQTLLLGGDPDREGPAVMAVHQNLYKAATPGFLYRRMIEIPLAARENQTRKKDMP